MSTFFDLIEVRLALTISPAFENTRSLGTDVADVSWVKLRNVEFSIYC